MENGMVIFAKDVARVAAFYAQVLTLEAVEEEVSHIRLVGRACELVVHAIPEAIREGIEISDPPRLRGETPFKPVYVVADLDAVRQGAEATGGGLHPAESAWSFRGATVLDGWDPEGNVVQFKQPDR